MLCELWAKLNTLMDSAVTLGKPRVWEGHRNTWWSRLFTPRPWALTFPLRVLTGMVGWRPRLFLLPWKAQKLGEGGVRWRVHNQRFVWWTERREGSLKPQHKSPSILESPFQSGPPRPALPKRSPGPAVNLATPALNLSAARMSSQRGTPTCRQPAMQKGDFGLF